MNVKMNLVQRIRFMLNHPLNRNHRVRTLVRYLRWQAGSRLVPGKVLVDWVNGTRMIASPGESGVTGEILCGLREFGEMAFVMHFLRRGDLFVDVGANVGSYTVLACGAAGAEGVAIEPVPSTYRRLLVNVTINGLSGRVRCLNVGIGDREGKIRFTTDENCTNHVVAQDETCGSIVEIRTIRLDGLLRNRCPVMIKVDVEGYEQVVLQGAPLTLGNPKLLAVIMELNGSGRRYGMEDAELHRMMRKFGFAPYQYMPFSRTLVPLANYNHRQENTLYCRRIDQVRKRILTAPVFSIMGQTL
jgi:FkbM family methyltransferase